MAREIVIDNRVINDESDCYVIAEIGHNHQGSMDQCMELFSKAKECGADAVKLQKRHNRSLFIKEMYSSSYASENAFGETYGEHREALELDKEEYTILCDHAKALGITFFSTAFDFQSADFLAELDMPVFKMASGDLTNIPLLKYVAQLQKPMIVSTGGGTMADVRRAYEAVMPINQKLCLMQCTAGYPPAFEELNIRVIETFREEFPEIVIGFSSHDSGIAMPITGYMLGARMVEKHFTLNRTLKGTDHAFSLEPTGLRKVVRDLKRTRIALGDGIKRCYQSEEKPLYKMAKKLVVSRDLLEGHVLTREDIAIKSPNDGIPPYELDNLIGKVTIRFLSEDENISYADLCAPKSA